MSFNNIARSALLSTVVALGCNANASVTKGTVAGWQLGPDGNFSFYLTGSPEYCQNGNGSTRANSMAAVVAGVRGYTTEGVRTAYSTVMAAFLAGKQVTVYVDENQRTIGWGCTVYALDVSN